ncbi:MAG: Holliday junction resolvase RuvX [Saprospiraceae bacterium]|nr:Holliday junction resolvase RuvX [Saprospiraceae bacterium]MBK9631067.1 Holliday junction resolvase RuvX [Saprospiraceae bacterium]
MARILCIDYGRKRCGLAVTDPLQLIVNQLDSVKTEEILNYIVLYCKVEPVEKIVFGMPFHTDGNDTLISEEIRNLASKLQLEIPNLLTDFQEEAFSSVKAKMTILKSGVPQKKRRDKELVDRVSAVIILQEYLGHF